MLFAVRYPLDQLNTGNIFYVGITQCHGVRNSLHDCVIVEQPGKRFKHTSGKCKKQSYLDNSMRITDLR